MPFKGEDILFNMWKFGILLTLLLYKKVLADHHVQCYYRNWAQYGKGVAKFLPEDINPHICSIIKFAFMRVNTETFEIETTKENDEEMLGRLNALKNINPKLKVVIAVGGWNHEKEARFSKMVETEQTRQTFIQSVVAFLKKHKLDGLSYNWLYPVVRPDGQESQERSKFTSLLMETYQAFKNNGNCFYLSATVSSSVMKIPKSYEIAKIANHVDGVDVIVHSLWGYWKRRTGSPSAMKGNQPTVIEAIELWLKSGMPAYKINVGFALYGRTFKLESSSNYQLGARTIGPGEKGTYTRKKGVLAYYEICSRSWPHQTPWVKSETESPYASDGDLWVAYDNPSSFQYKIQYLLQKYNLQGVTLWALDLDDFTGTFCNDGKFPITRRIYSGVKMAEEEAEKPKIECKVAVDIGFILDSSGSLRYEYQTEKDFLKSIAQAFGLSKDGSRAAVITFSYWAEHSIKLKDYFNILSFSAAVDAIPLMGYTTRLDRSLRLVQKEMFTEESGARKDSPKLLVLLTDGSQTLDDDAEEPGDIADELRVEGVNIIVVGIGQYTDPVELLHMAGGQNNLFMSQSFKDLLHSRMINNVREQSCPSELRLVEKEPVEEQPEKDVCKAPVRK